MAFEENKHPRDKDGKFTSKGNEGSKSSNNRQEELENKYNSDLPGKPKKKNYIELPKKEYAQMCSAIRTRYTNNIPNKGNIFFDNSYYVFKYIKSKEQVLCINKIKIEGNEEIIKQMEQNKK